jgi:putative addiction module killer protein
MRIDYGPGYRVYYTMCGQTVIILLAGGAKKTQAQDNEPPRSKLRGISVFIHNS